MKKLYTPLLFWMLLSPFLQAQTIKVVAAADLRYAMNEIADVFREKNPDIKIDFVYGSSGHAFTQIMNGAPYDLYFSADRLYPQKLNEAGLSLTEPKLYAIGRIVFWSTSIDVTQGLLVLKNYPKARVAIANPVHAPYGMRAMESLKYYQIYEKLKTQLVMGENISQAAQFCITGNADAGILALSLACSPGMKGAGNYSLIDENSHQPLEQAYILLKRAEGNEQAKAFYNFIGTEKVRSILEKYGFNLPDRK